MKKEMCFIAIIWGGVSYRFGVFTTENKAKQFLKGKIKAMKVWVESIDDGLDKHFIKDDLIAHINFNEPLEDIAKKISALVDTNQERDYEIIITSITPNQPIKIN